MTREASVYSPGLAIVASLLPPSANSFVSSYLPNFVTGAVPPLTGIRRPCLDANRVDEGAEVLVDRFRCNAPASPPSELLDGDCPFTQSPSLLPWDMSAAPFSTLMAHPVLK